MPSVSPEVHQAIMEDELLSQPFEAQEFYLRLLSEGQSPTMAHMLAMRQAPMMGGSDRTFNEGARYRMNNMAPKMRAHIIKQAESAGISTSGKYYVGGLGRYNNPDAWVSTADDILDVAKRRPELTLSGSIKRKGNAESKPPLKKKKLADDIAARLMTDIIKAEPKTKESLKNGKMKPQELHERVVAKYGNPKGEI